MATPSAAPVIRRILYTSILENSQPWSLLNEVVTQQQIASSLRPLHTMICRRVIAHGVLIIGMIFSHLHRLQCIHDHCGTSSTATVLKSTTMVFEGQERIRGAPTMCYFCS
jgi:hypothetical protein